MSGLATSAAFTLEPREHIGSPIPDCSPLAQHVLRQLDLRQMITIEVEDAERLEVHPAFDCLDRAPEEQRPR